VQIVRAGVFLVWLAGMAGAQAPPPRAYAAVGRFETEAAGENAVDPVILERFKQALKDAERADPARVSHTLIPVRPDNDGLIWKGDGEDRRVLATVMTSYHGYDPLVGSETQLTREVWVTMAQELREFCSSTPTPRDGMVLRLEQLIGLNPSGRDRLVEMWVRPADLFRPAPDPEITDREAELDFPQAGSSLQISADHVKWINDLKAISYGPSGMPWTRLGYTYDWGNPQSILGLSEFVVRLGSKVEINSVSDPADYCSGAGAAATPLLNPRGIVNLASGLGGGVAPGEWLVIGGLRLSDASAKPPARVWFDGVEAQVTAFSPSRLHALAPECLRGRFRTRLVVETAAGPGAPLDLPVLDSAPGVFTGDHSGAGPADALNEDGSRNTADQPAPAGSVLTFWVTGMSPRQALNVRIGERWIPPDDMIFSGEVEPGVYEVQVRTPREAPPGTARELRVTAGRAEARRGVTVFVR
jgi:uncharacterized protein (TIGR03437 family)